MMKRSKGTSAGFVTRWRSMVIRRAARRSGPEKRASTSVEGIASGPRGKPQEDREQPQSQVARERRRHQEEPDHGEAPHARALRGAAARLQARRGHFPVPALGGGSLMLAPGDNGRRGVAR